MKKKISLIIFTLIIMLVNCQVFALSLEKNEINIPAGEKKNIKLYADLPEDTVKVEFTLVFDSYDIPVYFSPTSGITDETPNGIKHTLILNDTSNGETLLGSIIARVVNNPNIIKAGADLHSANAYDQEGNKTQLNSQNLQVKIGENSEDNPGDDNQTINEEPEKKPVKTETKKTYNLLEEIKSGDNTILIIDDVFEYELKVLNSVQELNLEVIPKDDKYKIEISSQVISELVDNKITITVTNGKEKQDYVVNLKIIKDTPDVIIDNTEFKASNGHKGFWVVVLITASIGLFAGAILLKNKK